MLVFEVVIFGVGRLGERRAWCLVVRTYRTVHSDRAGATVTLQALIALDYKLFSAVWRFGMSSADDTIQRDPDVSNSRRNLVGPADLSVVEAESPSPICIAMHVSMPRSNIRGGFTPHDVTLSEMQQQVPSV